MLPTTETDSKPRFGAAQPSILFPTGKDPIDIESWPQPDCFPDLNLHQIVDAVIAGREEYNLRTLFHCTTRDPGIVQYRHEVFRDLQHAEFAASIRAFASEMWDLRQQLAQMEKAYYEREKQRCLLDAVALYCEAVRHLEDVFAPAEIQSEGLRQFAHYLKAYGADGGFCALERQVRKLLEELESICYSLLIEGKTVTLRRYDPEPDYGTDVLETFAKFRQEAAKEHSFRLRPSTEINHVEAAILDRVALLYPATFAELAEFSLRQRGFVDSAIARFDREVQFYLAWLECKERMQRAGMAFCYPAVTNRSKEVSVTEAYDLALAEKLHGSHGAVVPNSFSLSGEERILIVTGPNQGGKTTFARMFGQLHYLAGLGCPVPAKQADLFLCDQMFTHFDRQEDVENLRGKLEDELLRIHQILDSATSDSILILNESFLSTTVNDALFLSRQVLDQILVRDMLGVSVTFLDELASIHAKTVSMVGEVDPSDPTRRTFRILRKPANGLAYAMAIAEKYRLREQDVQLRITGITGGSQR